MKLNVIIPTCFVVPILALALTGGKKEHSLREVKDHVPKVILFKYFLSNYYYPDDYFMPKDRSDWTLSYLVDHPKRASIGWYLMEKSFYKYGLKGALNFISNLYDLGYEHNSLELRFDAWELMNFFSPTQTLNLAPKRGTCQLSDDEMAECVKQASADQAVGLERMHLFHSDISMYKWLLGRFPKNSITYGIMGFLCDDDQVNLRYRPPRTEEEKRTLTTRRAIEMYEKAVQLYPGNIIATSSLIGDLETIHDYKSALKYAKSGRDAFLREKLPKDSFWVEFNNAISYCKQELGIK